MKITIKGKANYWRFTVYNWVLEIKEIIEQEISELVELNVIDGENDDPELYIDDYYIGTGVPGEEGYLIEIIKKAYKQIRGNTERNKTLSD